VTTLIDSWKESKEAIQLTKFVNSLHKTSDLEQVSIILKHAQRTKANFWTQFAFLSGRAIRNFIRNFMLLHIRMFRAIFIGLIIGLIYWDIPSHIGYAQFQDRASALAFYLNNELMSSASTTILVFSFEKPVFRREFQAGYYSILAYYASKVLIELPFSILSPCITIAISYFMVGFRSGASHFFTTMFTGVLLSMVANAMGVLMAAVFPDVQAAMTIFPMIILPLMLFAGLMVNIKNIPIWFKFMPYISPLKYAFTAAAKNEFSNVIFPNCIPDGRSPCTGNEALQLLGFDTEPPIYINWIALFSIYILFILSGYLALWRTTRRS